jgi:hypothetical protein
MDRTCFALPVVLGKREDFRAFLREAERARGGARATAGRVVGLAGYGTAPHRS